MELRRKDDRGATFENAFQPARVPGFAQVWKKRSNVLSDHLALRYPGSILQATVPKENDKILLQDKHAHRNVVKKVEFFLGHLYVFLLACLFLTDFIYESTEKSLSLW